MRAKLRGRDKDEFLNAMRNVIAFNDSNPGNGYTLDFSISDDVDKAFKHRANGGIWSRPLGEVVL
jgi:hypothetical protein